MIAWRCSSDQNIVRPALPTITCFPSPLRYPTTSARCKDTRSACPGFGSTKHRHQHIPAKLQGVGIDQGHLGAVIVAALGIINLPPLPLIVTIEFESPEDFQADQRSGAK